jgi:allantoate deiminase
VGSIEAHPGASNVIPGEVRLTLDVRHRCDAVRDAAAEYLLQQAKAIAGRRGLQSEHEIRLIQPAVSLDSTLIGLDERALAACNITPIRLVSGAGHDAMIMSERVPSVMIFLRSPEGISHHPDETVRPEDVKLALAAGLQFLNQLAGNLSL